ncbi:MAG TPA: sigma factor-like helix-turn-helix DNA-binding protein [Streptosporangiaceae bacterium]|nr:sigma factor-like helix-turn-helix DNA-binding protein [Streptosporangiaceae bacterium]
MTTFFIGNCAFAFHAVMREQYARHQLRLADASALVDLPLVERTPGPADRAEIMDSLRQILRKAKPEARQICGLILRDLSRAEIATVMGISERAVEGHMYRLRRRVMVVRGEIEPYGRRAPATAELVAS